MAFRKYQNLAWQDVSFVRKYQNLAWQDVSFVRKYQNLAWQDVFPNTQYVTASFDNHPTFFGVSSNYKGSSYFDKLASNNKMMFEWDIEIPTSGYGRENLYGTFTFNSNQDLLKYFTLKYSARTVALNNYWNEFDIDDNNGRVYFSDQFIRIAYTDGTFGLEISMNGNEVNWGYGGQSLEFSIKLDDSTITSNGTKTIKSIEFASNISRDANITKYNCEGSIYITTTNSSDSSKYQFKY